MKNLRSMKGRDWEIDSSGYNVQPIAVAVDQRRLICFWVASRYDSQFVVYQENSDLCGAPF